MNNILDILNHYLKQEGYVVSHQKIKERLFSDPDNNIAAITNTLDFFNIKNIVAEVPKDTFYDLPINFIAQVTKNGLSNLVLVCKESQGIVKVYFEKGKNLVLSNAEFMQHWSGLILAIEKNAEKRVLSLKTHLTNLIAPLILMAILVLFYLTHKNPVVAVLLVLTLIGLAASWLILKEKYQAADIASAFCHIGKNTNCKGVINSSSSKLFNTFDLADLSFIYFSTIATCMLIFGFNGLLAVSVTLSLLVVPYALYQQGVVLKQWCPLCLVVSAVLLFQGLIVLCYSNTYYSKMLDVAYLLVFGLLSVLLLKQVKLFLVSKLQIENLSIQNLSFRRDYKLFIPYYNSLNEIDTQADKIREISLGVRTPILKLTIITNPLCKSCIEAHKTYMNLLKSYNNRIQLNFRFLVPSNDRTDHKTIISERLLQLYFEDDIGVFLEAFNDWYNNVNVKNWTKKWRKCEDLEYNNVLYQHMHWSMINGILSTPITLINDRLFPLNYNFKDIINFIEPILEHESGIIEQKNNNIHT